MSLDNPINRQLLTIPSETSRLTSQREPLSLSHLYKLLRQSIKRNEALTNQVSQLTQQVAALQQPTVPSRLHPFKIYQMPNSLRTFVPPDAPFRCKVRGGLVRSDKSASGDFFAGQVAGTDGAFAADAPTFLSPEHEVYLSPYTSQVPPTDNTQISPTWNEVVVPQDGQTYYFWISLLTLGSASPVLRFGNNTASCTDMNTGSTGVNDSWNIGGGSFDPYHIQVGTATVLNGLLYIQQVVRTDITIDSDMLGSGHSGDARRCVRMRYCGDYNGAYNYFIGDIVTQTAASGGFNWLYKFIYWPPSGSAYQLSSVSAPLSGVDPQTNSPDPWKLLSKSPVDADYHIDASYQAAKGYLRTA